MSNPYNLTSWPVNSVDPETSPTLLASLASFYADVMTAWATMAAYDSGAGYGAVTPHAATGGNPGIANDADAVINWLLDLVDPAAGNMAIRATDYVPAGYVVDPGPAAPDTTLADIQTYMTANGTSEDISSAATLMPNFLDSVATAGDHILASAHFYDNVMGVWAWGESSWGPFVSSGVHFGHPAVTPHYATGGAAGITSDGDEFGWWYTDAAQPSGLLELTVKPV